MDLKKMMKWCELGFDHECVKVSGDTIDWLNKVQEDIKKMYGEYVTHEAIIRGLAVDYLKHRGNQNILEIEK